jgi:hypothetical protein
MIKPEFVDIFGFIAFVFLAITSIYVLKKVKKHPKWILYIVLAIGVIGAIVDGIIVYTTYLK